MPDVTAADGFTEDRLLGGRVIVRQPVVGYRVAIDPVLLAAAVVAPSEGRVLDAGCGTGAAMFCLAARCKDLDLTGLERDPEAEGLARAGVDLNGLASRARIIAGDLAAPSPDMPAAFDVVMTNPPFIAEGTAPPHPGRAAAHYESDLDLAGWIAACLRCVKTNGRLVLIHRADRLSEILGVLRGPAGDIRIRPIYPKAAMPAQRVIVDAGKGRRSPDTLLPGLILHEADGAFTAAADTVLRDAAPLT